MEDHLATSACANGWFDELVDSLAENRERVDALLAQQRRRTSRFEATIDGQLRQILDQMAHNQQVADAREEYLNRREREIDEQSAQFLHLKEELSEQLSQMNQLQAQAAGQQEALIAELSQYHQQFVQQQIKVDNLDGVLESESNEADGNDAVMQELSELRVERQQLLDGLAEAESQRRVAPATGSDLEQVEDLQRRLEMALDEVRDLKSSRAAREQQLAEATACGDAVGVDAATISEMLHRDEVITQERQNLRKLQEEWRTKLRQAEIEISTERAKLARDRNAMEERIAACEELQANTVGNGPKGEDQKPARGRWLARLGLLDDNND